MRTVGKIGIVVVAASVTVAGVLAAKAARQVRQEMRENGNTLFDLLSSAAAIGRSQLSGAVTAVANRAGKVLSFGPTYEKTTE